MRVSVAIHRQESRLVPSAITIKTQSLKICCRGGLIDAYRILGEYT